MRLCWICLLALSLPIKGWALVGGAHCQGQVQAQVLSAPAAMAAGMAAAQTEVDEAACPHHAASPGAHAVMDEATSADTPAADGAHTCSACAHCNTGSAPPSIWLAPLATELPHLAPQADTTRWQSATPRQMDRPPTRRAA